MTDRNAISSITVLSWFNYPDILLISFTFFQCLKFIIGTKKVIILGIIYSFNNVKSKR